MEEFGLVEIGRVACAGQNQHARVAERIRKSPSLGRWKQCIALTPHDEHGCRACMQSRSVFDGADRSYGYETRHATRVRQQEGETEELEASHAALGAETISQVSEWTRSGLLSLAARLFMNGTPLNSVLTNVPGPQQRLYRLESRLLEIHPPGPLMGTVGVGIALFSYDGILSRGFSADWNPVRGEGVEPEAGVGSRKSCAPQEPRRLHPVRV